MKAMIQKLQLSWMKKVNRMKKKIICFMAALALLVCGCSDGGASADAETVSMYDLSKAMLSADDSLPDMTSVSSSDDDAENLFGYLSDLEYDKVDSFFLSYSSEGLADEIAVIAVKDISDVSEAKDTLDAQVKSRLNTYTQYDPSQVERVEDAVVFTSGRYAVLIICDKSDAVKAAFNDFISQ